MHLPDEGFVLDTGREDAAGLEEPVEGIDPCGLIVDPSFEPIQC
jgi:hypothetical protein